MKPGDAAPTPGAHRTDAPAAAAVKGEPGAAPPPARPTARLRLASAAFIVLVGLGGYAMTGSWSHWRSAPPAAEPPGGHAMGRQQFEALVAKLEERLAAKPDDPEGFAMLGRSKMALGQLEPALAAYRKSLSLRPQDPHTMADYADALAARADGRIDGEALAVVERVLAIDPDHLKALALAGTAAFQRDDFATAARHWERAARTGPPEHVLVKMAREAAAEARERVASAAPAPASGAASAAASGPGAGAVAAAAATKAAPTGAAGAGPALAGVVQLDPALAAQAGPEETVFVLARAADDAGRPTGMPLAILRRQVKDLPLTFTLDDTMAMSPAARLSQATKVVVTARISRSGQAAPQPGDLEGTTAPLAPGARDIALRIATVRR